MSDKGTKDRTAKNTGKTPQKQIKYIHYTESSTKTHVIFIFTLLIQKRVKICHVKSGNLHGITIKDTLKAYSQHDNDITQFGTKATLKAKNALWNSLSSSNV